MAKYIIDGEVVSGSTDTASSIKCKDAAGNDSSVQAVLNEHNKKMQCNTLWENPSPNSAFSAKTITVENLSQYNMIMIEVIGTIGETDHCQFQYINLLDNVVYRMNMAKKSTAGAIFRTFSVDGDNITFGKGYSASTESSEYFVPKRIIGVL